jgi:tetratricopeptide (TPR) repeat protein/serine/threonine protein kinase
MPVDQDRAKSLFLNAAELSSAAEREAYLAAECGGDLELRREVADLLSHHVQAGAFLESPAPGLAATVAESPCVERPGAVIGPYRLHEQLGEGGFGVVFRAEQQQPVRRQVALKVLKPGMDTRQVVARFEAERQTLAILDHPHIARVYDGGVTPSGRPFFVMELVNGVPVTDFCDQNRLTPRQRLELFLPVCQAVQHAHQKGIIHRDLKPSNVLVALHDGVAVPKVIDFGIAKALGQEGADPSLLTGAAQMIGTPLYMSPEQAVPGGRDIDTRSDIYSLGVILYELLTGTTPLTREHFHQASDDDIRRIVREVEPPRPSARLAGSGPALATIAARRRTEAVKLTRLVRGELDWIVIKALEKDRGRRYDTASSFALDVQRYLAGEPVSAFPPSPGYRLRKFARRHKARLAALAGVFLAVLMVAASIGWAVRDRAARQAEAQAAETARRAEVARQVRNSLDSSRALLAEDKVGAARQRLAQARAQLGTDGAVLDSLATEIAALEFDLDRFQQFLDLIDRAHQAETAASAHGLLLANGHAGGAEQPGAKAAERRPAAAVPLVIAALGRYGVLTRDDWTASLHGGLLGTQQVEHVRRLIYEELLWLAADVLGRRQRHPFGAKLSPETAARQALVYLGKSEGAHPPTPAFYVLRAQCHRALGDVAAAEADARLAAATAPVLALDHSLRGQAAFRGKKQAEAIAAFEAALQLEPTHYWSFMWLGYCLCDLGRGPDDFAGAVRVFTGCILKRPDHAHAYYCRANAYLKLHRNEEALADSSAAIALEPKHAQAWCDRGWAYHELGQLDRAVADCSRSIELDPTYALAWNNRGAAYASLGQPEKALDDMCKAVEVDPELALAWHNRGVLHNRLGQTELALAAFCRVLELDPRHLPTLYARASTYSAVGQPDQAVLDFSAFIALQPNDAEAWASRGAVHSALGQHDKALADCSEAIQRDPQLMLAWYNRGAIHDKLGRPKEAVADFTQAIALDPNCTKAWYNRGIVHDQLNQWEQAVNDFTEALRRDPGLALAWYNRGVVYNKLGQTKLAVADYDEALARDAKHAPTWTNRGLAYSKLGKTDKALMDLSQALAVDPTHVPAWCGRGWVYHKVGQPEKVVENFTQALELDPNPPQVVLVYLLRGQAHDRLGSYLEARVDYLAALKRVPDHAWANHALAWLLANCPDANLRDPHQAVELARKAVRLAPKEADCWRTLGAANYRVGDWNAAVAALDRALQLRPAGDVGAWFFLAMARQKLRDRDAARLAYQEALRWLAGKDKVLTNDRILAEELRRFQNEAREVLAQTRE